MPASFLLPFPCSFWIPGVRNLILGYVPLRSVWVGTPHMSGGISLTVLGSWIGGGVGSRSDRWDHAFAVSPFACQSRVSRVCCSRFSLNRGSPPRVETNALAYRGAKGCLHSWNDGRVGKFEPRNSPRYFWVRMTPFRRGFLACCHQRTEVETRRDIAQCSLIQGAEGPREVMHGHSRSQSRLDRQGEEEEG